MAFARIRHNLAGGDFDRSANQQRVLQGSRPSRRDNADKPGWIETGRPIGDGQRGHQPRPGRAIRIAQAVAQVDPKKITGCVVPGGIGNIGGASVVLPYTDTAKRYGDDARTDASIKNC